MNSGKCPRGCRGARSGNADKVAIMDDGRAHLLGLLCIYRKQRRVKGCWPYNFAVEHVRQLLIRRITVLARDKVASIHLHCRLARDLPVRPPEPRGAPRGGKGVGAQRNLTPEPKRPPGSSPGALGAAARKERPLVPLGGGGAAPLPFPHRPPLCSGRRT